MIRTFWIIRRRCVCMCGVCVCAVYCIQVQLCVWIYVFVLCDKCFQFLNWKKYWKIFQIKTEKKITHTVELFGLIESIRIYLKIIKTTNNQEKKITKQNLKKKSNFIWKLTLIFMDKQKKIQLKIENFGKINEPKRST